MALEQAGDGEDRADAHLIRLATRHGPAFEGAEGLQATPLGLFGFHQHQGGRAVGQLAGVARRHIFAGAFDRFELGQAFECGVGAVAFVAVHDDVLERLFLGDFVHHFHLGGDRNDFVLEQAGRLRRRHSALRLQ